MTTCKRTPLDDLIEEIFVESDKKDARELASGTREELIERRVASGMSRKEAVDQVDRMRSRRQKHVAFDEAFEGALESDSEVVRRLARDMGIEDDVAAWIVAEMRHDRSRSESDEPPMAGWKRFDGVIDEIRTRRAWYDDEELSSGTRDELVERYIAGGMAHDAAEHRVNGMIRRQEEREALDEQELERLRELSPEEIDREFRAEGIDLAEFRATVQRIEAEVRRKSQDESEA